MSVTNKTPKECWSERIPSISHRRVFGYVAFAHIPIEKQTKLDLKSIHCLMIGYNDQSKAYCLFNLLTNKVLISQDRCYLQ